MPPAGITVQIFGTMKNADTRKALRFFAERRVQTHFVDLQERAASVGELRRFAQKFGVEMLIDRESKRSAELGLRTALYGAERRLASLAEEPLALRQPLVRMKERLTVGAEEGGWRGGWGRSHTEILTHPERLLESRGLPASGGV